MITTIRQSAEYGAYRIERVQLRRVDLFYRGALLLRNVSREYVENLGFAGLQFEKTFLGV